MITLAWPWLLLLLPLPFVVRWFAPAYNVRSDSALKTPFIEELSDFAQSGNPIPTLRWRFWLALMAWTLLVLAASQPQWLSDPVALPQSGRDLLLAMDISGSMREEDFSLRGHTLTRIEATKIVASDFIERRQGDRVGLILFGEQAYLQAPLTFDRTTVQTLMSEAAIGLAGKATAIGDAIGLSIKRMEGSDDNRVLILLTDGANTAGEVSPLKAAELAAESGIKIYTIGIGADEMMVRSLFGSRKVNPSADLDEDTLKTIAESTGGRYFRARNTDELNQIYHLLDELEPIEKDQAFFRPQRALYPWPLGAAIAIAGLLLLSTQRFGKSHG